MILFLACCAVLVLGTQSATTPSVTVTHPHHSKDPNQKENFQFRYDGARHTLIVKVAHECYIMKLTAEQRTKISDPDAMRTVEADALSAIANRHHQKDVDQATLNHHLQHDCNGATKIIQLINRQHHAHQTTPMA